MIYVHTNSSGSRDERLRVYLEETIDSAYTSGRCEMSIIPSLRVSSYELSLMIGCYADSLSDVESLIYGVSGAAWSSGRLRESRYKIVPTLVDESMARILEVIDGVQGEQDSDDESGDNREPLF